MGCLILKLIKNRLSVEIFFCYWNVCCFGVFCDMWYG